MNTAGMITAAALAALAALGIAIRGDDDVARVMLARIVQADRAAMEANELLAIGVIDHDRYERSAQDRDEAIDAAATFLGVQ